MRGLAIATILLLSSSLPSLAEDAGKTAVPTQPQAVPVPQQGTQQPSDQLRDQDERRGDDTPIGRDRRAKNRDDRYDDDRATGRDDRDNRPVGRNWRMDRDGERGDRDWDRRDQYQDRRTYSDDNRGRRRTKTCVEYENGDEYCRYRD
jgi:hypothetical protein